MFCKNCGTELNEDNLFCPKCGVAVESNTQQPKEATQTQEATVEEPVVEVAVAEEPMVTEPAVNPGKGLGIASLILGIIAVAFGTICSCACACLGGLLPLICGILGIVFGAIACKKSKDAGFGNKVAVAGLILSIVSVVIILLFILGNGILGAINGVDSVFTKQYSYNYNYTI